MSSQAIPTAAKPTARSSRFWFVGALLIAVLILLPIVSLVAMALQGSEGLWTHLFANVLPVALRDSLMLLAGVGVIAGVIGTSTAWLVSAYSFPGRTVLSWALLLPLAVPTYIVAYAYLDILHPVGSVQGLIRDVLGYDSPRQFRLPDIRSMTGAILLLSLVLYPYVYLTTRAMFLTQSSNMLEAARSLGVKKHAVFWRVALPMARPAIAVGVSLALMEALNDIGASEFLGVRTLTVSVYSTWINRTDVAGAAQIACTILVIVVGLMALERFARRQQRYVFAVQRPRPMTPERLTGWRAAAALACGSLPVFLGFVAPAAYLVAEAAKRIEFAGVSSRLLVELWNTVSISVLATALILACGLVVAYSARLSSGPSGGLLLRISGLGYAVPGTVLAIGLLYPLGMADQLLASGLSQLFGVSVGLVFLGTGAALVYAYLARFLAISSGSIEAGFSRIPQSLDDAARTLGQTPTGVFRQLHLPLSVQAITAAGLLVFVDCMKELPATLLLRPLNFETLATHLYGEAARGTYEEASVAALIIVAVGILPVILLARVGQR